MSFMMRVPSIPLINVDPYFSLWSPYDCATEGTVKHWTGADNKICGSVFIDGTEYGFLGDCHNRGLQQTNIKITAFTTELTFENEQITLFVKYSSPLLPDDIELMSQPLGFMECRYISNDRKEHNVNLRLLACEELCLNKKGDDKVICEQIPCGMITCFKMGSKSQKVLNKCGDNVRIDWGYFYLATNAQKAIMRDVTIDDMKAIELNIPLYEKESELTVFAYDDIDCLIYFEQYLNAYWKKNGKTIEQLIVESFDKYDDIISKCYLFSKKLDSIALKYGNKKYAELLRLSIRQVMAAHKLAVDESGELIYISKECFSNGCAGTVDVAYPSSPLFMLYNFDLLEAMLRPVFRYAKSEAWQFEFAPHDIGRYPFCNGQVYFNNDREHQMPIEECGNMLIMCAALAKSNNLKLLKQNKTLLKQWANYLVKCGLDPENQLCTDDFSGHLAHNCNLSIKAIMGVKGYALIALCLGEIEDYEHYSSIALSMAKEWEQNAYLDKGWYKHTFDSDEGYSLKYNLVWDKVWNSELFSNEVYKKEINKYKTELKTYGVPLDQRADYTKSDWMLWIACLADNKEDFCLFSDAVWNAYNSTTSRVPMTDWYDSITAKQCTWVEEGFEMGFQHRSVQGGLFMRLLMDDYS